MLEYEVAAVVVGADVPGVVVGVVTMVMAAVVVVVVLVKSAAVDAMMIMT